MFDLLSLLASNNYVVYNSVLAKRLGPNCAIILGRLCSEYQFWQRSEKLQDGFFYATREHIYEMTGLSEDQQRTAIRKLESVGIVETKRIGVPSKTYYKINLDSLEAEISRSGKTEGLVEGKPDDLISEKSSQAISNRVIDISNKNILSNDNIERSSKGLFPTPPKQEPKKTLKAVIDRFTNCATVVEKLNKYVAVLKQVRGGSNISIIQFETMLEELAELSIEEKRGQGRQINFKLMADIIDQSIKKGWNGFYSLDSNSNNPKNGFDDTVGNKKLGSLSQLSETEKKKWEGSLKNEQF